MQHLFAHLLLIIFPLPLPGYLKDDLNDKAETTSLCALKHRGTNPPTSQSSLTLCTCVKCLT